MHDTGHDQGATRGMRRGAGDLFELEAGHGEAALTNADLAPTRLDQRTWGTYHIASLWVGLSVCIPTYMLASSLVGAGMDWKQAVFTYAWFVGFAASGLVYAVLMRGTELVDLEAVMRG